MDLPAYCLFITSALKFGKVSALPEIICNILLDEVLCVDVFELIPTLVVWQMFLLEITSFIALVCHNIFQPFWESYDLFLNFKTLYLKILS